MIPRAGSRLAALPAGVVDVWRVVLTPPALPLPKLHAVLDASEREHAERLGDAAAPWVAAHGALRMILAGYRGLAPEGLRFVTRATGKPALADAHGLEFSLTHSDTLALVAVASDRAVGADLERLREDVDIAAVTQEFLTAADAAAIEFTPADRRRAAFFAAWTRREARLKLHGQPLDSAVNEPPLPASGLVVTRALEVAPGFAAAIAAEGGSWTLRMRDFPESPGPR